MARTSSCAGCRRRLRGSLSNLKGFPTVVISAEASYHQLYDNCTVKYLKQAGLTIEWMPLQSKGIHGNGHMVMIEKNNLEIAKGDRRLGRSRT